MAGADGYLLQVKRSHDFNSLRWHDSKCRSIRVQPIENMHEVILELDMLTANKEPDYPKRCTLRLIDCTYLEAALDLDGKSIVGGALATASCDVSSRWKDAVQKKLEHEKANSLAPYLHFRVLFIHPGGEINALAKDFALVEEPSPASL